MARKELLDVLHSASPHGQRASRQARTRLDEVAIMDRTVLVMDRRRDGDHTQVHDNACPEVPDLRQPAYP